MRVAGRVSSSFPHLLHRLGPGNPVRALDHPPRPARGEREGVRGHFSSSDRGIWRSRPGSRRFRCSRWDHAISESAQCAVRDACLGAFRVLASVELDKKLRLAAYPHPPLPRLPGYGIHRSGGSHRTRSIVPRPLMGAGRGGGDAAEDAPIAIPRSVALIPQLPCIRHGGARHPLPTLSHQGGGLPERDRSDS
jgi:hypothetical protein